MTQLLITRKLSDAAMQQIENAGIDCRLNEADVRWSPEELAKQIGDVAAVICLLTDKMTAELMDAAPNLKLIANVAVGYDNIDVQAATERGILVTNTPDVLTETTADLAFALLLAIARRIVEADEYMRAGKLKSFELFPRLMGTDVFGKTLGIVGMGRIGTAVARRGALGFGMKVLYTANSPKSEAEAELGATRVDFATLLKESDFISINAPMTPQTHHLFTIKELRQMKPTACLINTARGPLVNEDDLVQALREGIIRGAALDVFEHEPLMAEGLADLKQNLIVAPHVGSATVETREKMALLAAQNAVAFLTGKRPLTPVNEVSGG